MSCLPQSSFVLQLFQLLTCDWLLETRTALWELEHMDIEDDGYYQVPGEVLEKFQTDLNSLRSIVENIPVSTLFPLPFTLSTYRFPLFAERTVPDLFV